MDQIRLEAAQMLHRLLSKGEPGAVADHFLSAQAGISPDFERIVVHGFRIVGDGHDDIMSVVDQIFGIVDDCVAHAVDLRGKRVIDQNDSHKIKTQKQPTGGLDSVSFLIISAKKV